MTIRALVQLARLSNLPTVWSNALVGFSIAGTAGAAPGAMALSIAGLSLLYVAGMAINDAADHRRDRAARPDRPIPSGRATPAAAWTMGALCMAAGLGALAPLGPPALCLGLVLAGSILAYDLLHARVAAAVLLMGACRALVYPAAAAALAWPIDGAVAGMLGGAMAAYIVVLTWIARRESAGDPGARGRLSLLLPVIALAPVALLGTPEPAWTAAAGVACACWLLLAARHVLRRPPRTGRAVLGWLSGICLIDALWLTQLGHVGLAGSAAGCFVLTAVGHRYILGT